MLHTILRNTPLSLLVISMLFSGVLSIATAQTPVARAVATTSVETSTDVNTPRRSKEMDAKRKAFLERTETLRTDAGARKEALTEHMTERRARISENVENRIRTVIANMQSRVSNAIARLGSVADRVESRAHKIEALGVNVDASLALVAEARTELRAASAIMNEDLAVEVDVAVTANEPKAGFEQVKESLREVHEHLLAAQKALREAVSLLKTAAGAMERPMTSTTTRDR